MAPIIYTIEDFEERLSELTIGTDDVKQLMEFVRRLDNYNNRQSVRLKSAATLLGYSMIEDAMLDEEL